MEIKTFKINDLPIHEQENALSKAREILAQLFSGYIESGELSEYNKAIIDSANANTLVAFIGSAVVGALTWEIEQNGNETGFIIFIDYLAVEPKYFRRGVGSALLSTLATIANQEGVSELDTISTVSPGRNFFIKNGFNVSDPSDPGDVFLTRPISNQSNF